MLVHAVICFGKLDCKFLVDGLKVYPNRISFSGTDLSGNAFEDFAGCSIPSSIGFHNEGYKDC